MPDSVFFDTNILVYAFDKDDPKRQDIAAALLDENLKLGRATMSLQVLQEFFVVTTSKIKSPLTPAMARALVCDFLHHRVVEPSAVHLLKAIDISMAHRLSFWDGLILAAASEAGCRYLYSDDLQHGAKLAGVEIINPFKV